MSIEGPFAELLHLRTLHYYLEGTSHTLLPPRMNTDASSLGRCPECGDQIPETWLLVEYEKDDGSEGIWAECPVCDDVVAPEQ